MGVTETGTVHISFFCSLSLFTLLHVGELLMNLSPWDGRIVNLLTCYSG